MSSKRARQLVILTMQRAEKKVQVHELAEVQEWTRQVARCPLELEEDVFDGKEQPLSDLVI
jgi:hypothetical protein